MLWVTWRHHRTQLAACLALLAAASLLLAVLGHTMHTAWNAGPAGCSGGSATAGCDGLLADFQTRYTGSLEQLLGWFNLLPALIGAFLGAPLVAREFETGTWRLAFTQAVPRTRWLTIKVLLLAGAVLTLTAVFAAVFGWYREPLDQLEGRFGPNAYDFEGLSLPACSLFAFGVGTLVGVLVHRTLAAMAITIGGFLAVRVPVETWLRPHLQPPVQVVTAAGQPQGGAQGDWTLANGLTDNHGTRLSDTAEAAVLRTARTAGGPQEDYLTTHGYGHWALIQPARRFWQFQLLEAGIYLTLTIACLITAVVILRRRPR